jgi:TRAP-type C4-dicarboxylate transport system permease small subunit
VSEANGEPGTQDDGSKTGGRPAVQYEAGLLGVVHRVEDVFLALLLGAMVLLAPLQIFLRNFLDEGVSWGDPLLRVLVLWVGLLGAVSASRGDRHITIDVLSRFVGERPRLVLRIVTSLFTVVVCGLVAWYSGEFVAVEREFESEAFNGMPAWILQVVIPFAFAAMGLRYGAYAFSDVMRLVQGRAADA